MEKPSKLRSKLFKCLIPHAASAATFQSPPLSPGKAFAAGRGSSGPFVSIIPPEFRRKPKKGSFDAREPTSPKVSCMGRVKLKNKKKTSKPKLVSQLPPQATMRVSCPKEAREKKPQDIVKINYFEGPKQGGKPDALYDKPTVPEPVPSLG